MLIYKIDVLSTLKNNGINTNKLRKEKLLSEGAIQRLRHNAPIGWVSLEQLCKLLNCQPGEIIAYVPDEQ